MREIYGNNGQVIFGDILTKDILNLPANKRIEDIPDNFLVTEEKQKKTYKGNLKIKATIGEQELEDNTDVYFHICYPMHVEMTTLQHNQWTDRFIDNNSDERIIFVPDE